MAGGGGDDFSRGVLSTWRVERDDGRGTVLKAGAKQGL